MKYSAPKMQERIAYHEAGHTLIAYLRQVCFQKIVLDFENDECPAYVYYGETHPIIYVPDKSKPDPPLGREDLYTNLLVSVAGSEAETVGCGWVCPVSEADYTSDWHFAGRLATLDGKDVRFQNEYLEPAQNEATRILEQHKAVLGEIVDRLRKDGAPYKGMTYRKAP